MSSLDKINIAIIDYGMGNLFSVQQACDRVGIGTTIATTPTQVLQADGIILPGVGAFGDAISNLTERGLDVALKTSAKEQKPIVGICLGMQLLFTESNEFGHHRGLDIVKGQVRRLENGRLSEGKLAIPHVGWSSISFRKTARFAEVDPVESPWDRTPLEGLEECEKMYFVHTFQCLPDNPEIVLSYTDYGPNRFCSAFSVGNVFGCQFHPEKSGPKGLRIYQNIARQIK